jgi:hypothetical protein
VAVLEGKMIEMVYLIAKAGALVSLTTNNTSLNVNVVPSTDWNLVVATLVLGICALAVPLLTKWAERNIYEPKLKISFSLAPPYCHITRYTIDGARAGEHVYYF